MNVGVLYSRIRRDEKLLLEELRDRDHEVTKVDVRRQQFGLGDPPAAFSDVDVLVDRCLATSRSVHVTQFAEAYGVPVVNSAETATVCANKVRNSLALSAADVPTPATEVAFTTDAALETVESFGYPCVLKPVVGSWGRLMAKLDSRSAAEAVLEHKETLGHYEHKIFYIQEFVEKPGRDIRVLAADGEPVAAMTRQSDHWLTNAAQGAETARFPVDDARDPVDDARDPVDDARDPVDDARDPGDDIRDPVDDARDPVDDTRDPVDDARDPVDDIRDPVDDIRDIVARASDAVGGGLLGVDLMEVGGADSGEYTVHEVNHTVEFKALNEVADVDVPGRVVDWLEVRFGAEGVGR